MAIGAIGRRVSELLRMIGASSRTAPTEQPVNHAKDDEQIVLPFPLLLERGFVQSFAGMGVEVASQ